MTNVQPGGGWLSGPMVNPLPSVAPHNPANDSPMVGEAFDALNAFGDDLDRATVRKLLPMWRHYVDLSPQDMVAILLRFPGKGEH